jgi:hypothetical protein
MALAFANYGMPRSEVHRHAHDIPKIANKKELLTDRDSLAERTEVHSRRINQQSI